MTLSVPSESDSEPAVSRLGPPPDIPARLHPEGDVPAENLTAASLEVRRAEWLQVYPDLDDTLAREYWANVRMRWNCHSNAIGGNTLTYAETVLLLLFGETRGSHLIREYEEMQGHDVAIERVKQWVDEGHVPHPRNIQELHRILLGKPYWVPSSDGHSRHQIVPGAYKQDSNLVFAHDGRQRVFAPSIQVPARMEAFCRHLRAHLDFLQQHPATRDVVTTLTQIHRELILIHPFADGNGRLTRLLLNHVVMIMGFPPLVIELAQRDTYLYVVEQANRGTAAPMRDFLAAALSRSLDFALQVARGHADPSWHNEQGDPARPPRYGTRPDTSA